MKEYRALNERFETFRLMRMEVNPSIVMDLYQEQKIKLNKEKLRNG
ncbi:MAG: hypothetical protein IKY16_10435 [Bacteroidales bacterium]|nr:hypothetical protein [Bacteroidales bacterium]